MNDDHDMKQIKLLLEFKKQLLDIRKMSEQERKALIFSRWKEKS